MPHRPPRLVATDLDGTLLRSDGTISAHTSDTLRSVEAAGVDVVFVTGRPPRWMADVVDHVAGDGLAVCSNGALTVNLRSREVHRHAMFPAEQLTELVRRIRAVLPAAAFAVEYGWEFAAQREYGADGPYRPATLAELTTTPAAKLLVRQPARDSDSLLAELSQPVAGLATCTHSGIGAGLVEMGPPGVTKATALAELCAERGIAASEVVAFGDMPNDVAMLEWAGRSYAMAGAHPAALAAAPRRAPDNDSDGVASVLAALVDPTPTTSR